MASTEVPTTQQGWSYTEFGPSSVLKFGELPVQPISDEQVLVKVAAASLNPIDFMLRNGFMKRSDTPPQTTPGFDLAGVVVKIGSKVTSLKVGDEVFSNINPKQFGTLSQYVAVDAGIVALKPSNLSFAEAASLPVAILTAYQGFEHAKLQAGETVFIVGGAGGVGTMALQLAKKFYKASLVATSASGKKAEFVKSLGANVAVDYTTQDYTELPERYDVVLDLASEGLKSIKILKEGGRHVTSLPPAPPPSIFVQCKPSSADLNKLSPFLESGEIRPVLDPNGMFTFSQVKEAYEYLETKRASGKVVISPIS
eukprot:TRINITY_DN4339_c0_g1_i1.p1 TRINITY_DN4339_c0_g1~~TRINITY_DN4339_c0_g1_i1.p1  ORF type:complete len:312 (+),score=57.88 TRINITY_DN4339_c0_g1_i1:88-1023(+)